MFAPTSMNDIFGGEIYCVFRTTQTRISDGVADYFVRHPEQLPPEIPFPPEGYETLSYKDRNKLKKIYAEVFERDLLRFCVRHELMAKLKEEDGDSIAVGNVLHAVFGGTVASKCKHVPIRDETINYYVRYPRRLPPKLPFPAVDHLSWPQEQREQMYADIMDRDMLHLFVLNKLMERQETGIRVAFSEALFDVFGYKTAERRARIMRNSIIYGMKENYYVRRPRLLPPKYDFPPPNYGCMPRSERERIYSESFDRCLLRASVLSEIEKKRRPAANSSLG